MGFSLLHSIPSVAPGMQSKVGALTRSRLVALLLFLATVLYGANRIRFGIDLEDEGMYLSAPLRYALGDVPFRDEFLNPHRMFDIVLSPLFRFFPDITVLELRALWLLIQMGSAVALYRLFRRFAPDAITALACVSPLYLANVIWTPGYHVMGTFGFVLAFSLWLSACLSNRLPVQLGLGVASGCVFFGAALSYIPLLAVVAIPGWVLLLEIRRGAKAGGRAIATASHLGVLMLLGMGCILVFAYSGLLEHWLAAQDTVLSTQRYGTSIWEKVPIFLGDIGPQSWILAVATAVCGGLLFYAHAGGRVERFRATVAGSVLPAAVILGILLFIIDHMYAIHAAKTQYIQDTNMLVVFMIALGLHGSVLLFMWWARPDVGSADRDWWFVYTSMTVAALLLAFLHGYLSGMGFKVSVAMLPVFVPGLVLFYRCITMPKAEPNAMIVVMAICLAVGFGSYTVRQGRVYGDSPMSMLTAPFSQPRLAGIWSSPKRVAELDALTAALLGRVNRGDRLLVVGKASILYYLTGTRPALDHSWMAPEISVEVKVRSLERMISLGHQPRYVVRTRIPNLKALESERIKLRYPLHAYVVEHYSFEVAFGSAQIWRRKD